MTKKTPAYKIGIVLLEELAIQVDRVQAITLMMDHPDISDDDSDVLHSEILDRCIEVAHPTDAVSRFTIIENTGRANKLGDPVMIGHKYPQTPSSDRP